MATDKVKSLVDEGKSALGRGDTLTALSLFEKAAETPGDLSARSFLAYCMAKERGLAARGIAVCRECLEREPDNALHYLNLGRIYLIMRKRGEAIAVFREGLKRERNEDIVAELNRLGVRSAPVLRFLSRNNPINKYLGILLTMLKIRSSSCR